MTKQEFATLVVGMQAMYGEDFIGTEEALDVWYALLHDLDYQILSKALQPYMLTNKFKPTVAERARFAEIYQAIQRRKRTEVNVDSVLPNLREMVQNRLAELEQNGQKAIKP
ncbi:MAG: hypothetical protein IJF03_11235 [Lachnospiraceae bacterium]|nr:hypothetical protein [Lachnospiraceae bacterium]